MVDEIKESKSKKEVPVVKTIVVKELPTQQINKAKDESGIEFDLLTTEEALTLILEKINKIEKAVA